MHLSSCYFCGAALESPVEEYPVVPEAVASEDDRTVSLCPACRRKLDAVLEVVLDAVGEPATDEVSSVDPAEGTGTGILHDVEPPADDDLTAGSTETTAADSETAPEDGPEAGVDTDSDSVASRDTDTTTETTPTDAEATEAASTDSGPVGTEPADTTEGMNGDGAAGTDPPVTEATESADGDPETADDTVTAADRGTAAEDAGGGDDEDATATAATTETVTTEADDGAVGTDAETDEVAGDSTEDDQPSILSTPAAQKVVRLLQNREFPVDREEVAVVAANAYDIPRRDCADVIEALVAAGYVGADGDRLTRTE